MPDARQAPRTEDDVGQNKLMSGKRLAPTAASSGWEGMVAFAGIIFALIGAAQVMTGFVAIFNSGFYDVPSSALTVPLAYPIWGWVHLAVGILAVATGWGLLTGRHWARPTGIALAFAVAVMNLLFVDANPWSALITVAFSVLAIYAITHHDASSLRRPETSPDTSDQT